MLTPPDVVIRFAARRTALMLTLPPFAGQREFQPGEADSMAGSIRFKLFILSILLILSKSYFLKNKKI
jgi:hypothetical protein